jgi:hypothetical protein
VASLVNFPLGGRGNSDVSFMSQWESTFSIKADAWKTCPQSICRHKARGSSGNWKRIKISLPEKTSAQGQYKSSRVSCAHWRSWGGESISKDHAQWHVWYENFIYATMLNALEKKIYRNFKMEEALRKK